MRGDARRAVGRLLREEGGFTLSEMLVVTMMLTIVLFALYGIFDMSIRVFSFGNNKVEATQNARAGLERMAREIRAAYPYDKVTDPADPDDHVLFASFANKQNPGLPNPSVALGNPASDPANVRRSIVFGNDRPQGNPPAPNWKVDDNEVIEYRLVGPGPAGACPATGDRGVCALQRVAYNSGGAQEAVSSVMPNGLTFTFLKADRTAATAPDGTDVQIVSISLTVKVGDNAEQTLTTDVDLRGRGG